MIATGTLRIQIESGIEFVRMSLPEKEEVEDAEKQ
jgi:hypothetical protein